MTLETLTGYPLTTVFRQSAKKPLANAPLLVFVPGNPGLIDYYTTYLGLIGDEFPTFETLAISHAGYQTSGDFLGANNDTTLQEYYDIDYQVRHKVSIIKDALAQRGRGAKIDVYILCHSMGAYVVQRIAKSISQDAELSERINVKFIGLICPTIVDIAKSLLGIKFTRLFSILPIVQLALWICALLQFLLPASWVRHIIKNYIIAEPVLNDPALLEAFNNALKATYKIFLSRRIVSQALTMAQEELRVIRRDDDFNDWFFNELPRGGTHIWSFFAAHDYWVHESSRDYILARYHDINNQKVRFEIGESAKDGGKAIDHSFCIDQSVEFAEVTCRALKNV